MKQAANNSINTTNTSYYYLLILLKKKLIIHRVCRQLTVLFFMCSGIFAMAQPADTNPNGYNYFYFPSGVVSSEGSMINGLPVGKWKNYHENAKIKSEGIRNAQGPDSVWVFFALTGEKERIVTYASGIKEGPEKIFGKKGNLLEEFNNKVNKKEGKARYYYESGELYREVFFEAGKEEGFGFEYEKDGRLITILSFKQGLLRSIEKLNRFDSQGKKAGLWQEYHDNGKVKEEGIWFDGKKNGLFKVFDRKGELIRFDRYVDGEMVSDNEAGFLPEVRKEFHESGELKLVGTYRDDSKQGVFREYDLQGNIISSVIYENNEKTGEGIVDAVGMKQGQWILYFPGGEIRAKGRYIDGKREGEWAYFHKSGSTEQKGIYKNDLPEGSWVWFYESGKRWREEQFRKGKEDGPMIEYDENGEILAQGEYVDGLKNGPWFMEVGDHREEGQFVDGEKHGVWKWTFDKKEEIFSGEFNNGIPIGKHKFYFSTGVLKEEGKFKSGERHGDWKFYLEDGTLHYVIQYNEGEERKIDGMKTER